MSKALPLALIFPKPSSAKGQIVGQTNAFERPSNATKATLLGSVATPLQPHKTSEIA